MKFSKFISKFLFYKFFLDSEQMQLVLVNSARYTCQIVMRKNLSYKLYFRSRIDVPILTLSSNRIVKVFSRISASKLKGNKITESIYEVIVSSKNMNKIVKGFLPYTGHTMYKAEILTILAHIFGEMMT